ncbi:MAG: hypothetical protein U9R75_06800, partial [Candidatus Thermoplasmatota archaeon]|nr:hypothetical protein [Candidatus Thermoplasmatota archaeon]
EYQLGTHPLKWDTDGDGMDDGWELKPDNRGALVFDPVLRKYRWTLDPLNPDDWYLDPDHDGARINIWTPSPDEPGRYRNEAYYFPWINLYEYITGIDNDDDGIMEITTFVAPRIDAEKVLGGYDSDHDGIPDGWEFFWSDDDNDTLPTGWEMFYNGTFWNCPETYPYIDHESDWTPFTTSMDRKDEIFFPKDLNTSIGDLYPDRIDTNMDGLVDTREDLDLDGFDSGQEYRNGTDPTDPNSYPGSMGIDLPDSRKRKRGSQ